MAAYSMRGSGDNVGAVRQGTLLKLPRGKPSIFRTSSPWQERDFVLDVGKGTLSYYQKGQGGVSKGFKGELRLAGGLVSACGDIISGQRYVFELSECVDEDGGVQPLKLAANTQSEMEAWIVSIRATMKKHGAAAMRQGNRPLGLALQAQQERQSLMQGATTTTTATITNSRRNTEVDVEEQMREQHAQQVQAEEVYATQNKTMDAVGRIKAQLDDTQQLAAATGETLDQQGEQLDAINDDLDKLNSNVDRADKNFNQLEKWRIFGGHSKRRGAKAAKEERTKVEKQNAKFEAKQKAKAIDETEDYPSRPQQKKSLSHRNVTTGLKGRDDDEQATLDMIAQNDDQINSGLDDIDSMLDSLGDAARSLGDKTRAHNEKINQMTQNMDNASSGVAKINERASYNVRYLS